MTSTMPYALYREADVLFYEALQAGTFRVHIRTGVILHANGERAELPDLKTGYGRIVVRKHPRLRMYAHRAVWIAAHGLIPPDTLITHRNGHHWDNRCGNLQAKTGDVRMGTLIPH